MGFYPVNYEIEGRLLLSLTANAPRACPCLQHIRRRNSAKLCNLQSDVDQVLSRFATEMWTALAETAGTDFPHVGIFAQPTEVVKLLV